MRTPACICTPQPHTHVRAPVCRGLASYEPGQLPLPANTIRQMFGAGVRAGMYPLSAQQVYWYICWNAREVGLPTTLVLLMVSDHDTYFTAAVFG